jgi:hypothetical protein
VECSRCGQRIGSMQVHTEEPCERQQVIHDCFERLLLEALELAGRVQHAGYWAICLEPYHESAFPLMAKVPGCYGCGLLVCVTPGRCWAECL